LRSRYPIALALAVHGIAVTLRIPVGIWANDPASAPLRGVFVTPIALEAVVFIQVFAFLLVSLAKERVEAQLRVTALTDALTGLPNRRALLDRGAAMLAAAARSGGPVAVVVFDLDRFKDINDSFGHPVGDAVLRVFADATRSELRAGDCAGRIGGEEFAAVLTDADEAAAATAAERIMAAFTRLAAAVPGLDAACTTSAGIAAAKAGSRPTIDALLTVADRGLYDAKRAGGNVVRVGLAA
jgi:diguanylate cyclase (GGDEF)-like protein